jgi:hypothetical protein
MDFFMRAQPSEVVFGAFTRGTCRRPSCRVGRGVPFPISGLSPDSRPSKGHRIPRGIRTRVAKRAQRTRPASASASNEADSWWLLRGPGGPALTHVRPSCLPALVPAEASARAPSSPGAMFWRRDRWRSLETKRRALLRLATHCARCGGSPHLRLRRSVGPC